MRITHRGCNITHGGYSNPCSAFTSCVEDATSHTVPATSYIDVTTAHIAPEIIYTEVSTFDTEAVISHT